MNEMKLISKSRRQVPFAYPILGPKILKFVLKFFETPKIFAQYEEAGTIKAFNRWTLSSQHVTPTMAFFLNVVIKAFILAIHRLLVEVSK